MSNARTAHNGRIMNPESKKLIKTLIENPEKKFNKKALAEEADVSRDALYRRWDEIEQLVLDEKDNKYKLNKESDAVEHFRAILEKVEEVSKAA